MAATTEDSRKSLNVEILAFRSAKRAKDMFISDYGKYTVWDDGHTAKLACKIQDEYSLVKDIQQPIVAGSKPPAHVPQLALEGSSTKSKPMLALTSGPSSAKPLGTPLGAASAATTATASGSQQPKPTATSSALVRVQEQNPDRAALALRMPHLAKPQFHPHWKLYRVVSGHQGWIRCIDVDPTNQWFATGSADRTIKIWDLASGVLKLSLTGHISAVRGVAVSARHPYLFSCGEDKTVKCWDLEQNKVIRHYHGHLSACQAISLHPTLDVIVTTGRDATVRAWDMRTKAQIHCLTGHTNTVGSVVTQAVDPQIISGSYDSTIKMWDLAAGKCLATLTNHKKSIRALALHPKEFTFASAAADNIKQWYLPDGKFIQNCSGHDAVLNALAVNADGVMVSGGDNGSLRFWDYKTGYNFQREQSLPQPGSLDSEAGIYAMTFDKSGSRLITVEADKTIKFYKEDEFSTEETHPLDWKPELLKKQRF